MLPSKLCLGMVLSLSLLFPSAVLAASPSFGSETIPDQRYIQNTAITLQLPEATGGDGSLTYTLTPTLPAGLTFDPTARTITGTPTLPVPVATTEYTCTATDSDGDIVLRRFTITVAEDRIPIFNFEPFNAHNYVPNKAIPLVALPPMPTPCHRICRLG